MSNSKWNRKRSIPISLLSEAQLKEAVHDWAEGSVALEELLWMCLNNGVITEGCDAGNHGHFPYIGLLVDESNREMMERVISATLKSYCSDVLFNFYSNPRSGPEWYKVSVMISPNTRGEKTDLFFREITHALESSRDDEEMNAAKLLMKLYDFLAEKCAPVDLGVRCNGTMYMIELKARKLSGYLDYFSDLFSKANLTKLNTSPDFPYDVAIIECGDNESLCRALINVLEVFENEWTFEVPDKLSDEEYKTNYGAKLMRMKFGTDERGVKLMNDWLNATKYEGAPEVNY